MRFIKRENSSLNTPHRPDINHINLHQPSSTIKNSRVPKEDRPDEIAFLAVFVPFANAFSHTFPTPRSGGSFVRGCSANLRVGAIFLSMNWKHGIVRGLAGNLQTDGQNPPFCVPRFPLCRHSGGGQGHSGRCVHIAPPRPD